MRKRWNMIAAAAAASLAMACTAWAGEWKSNETGWWYETENGNYMSGFMVNIDGNWYSFGENGYMVTGWLPNGEDWYYMDPSGARASGWREIGGKWYYFDEATGLMLRSTWKNKDGKRYYFHSNGQMAVGYFEPEEKKTDRDYFWYYADPEQGGAIKTDAEEGNMKFGPSGKIYKRSDDGENKWKPLETADELIENNKEAMEEEYMKRVRWHPDSRSELADEMETEARQKFGNILNEKDLETFIEDLASRILFE